MNGNVELAKLLIGQGISVNVSTEPPFPASSPPAFPHDIADSSKGESLVEEEGSDNVGNDSLPNETEELKGRPVVGLTPLQLSLLHNKPAVASLLLKHNASVNVFDEFGRSPLHYAAFHGNYEQVKLLIENNASPLVKDMEGYLPIHKAVWKGRKKCLELLLQEKNGSRTASAPSRKGYTPLHLSIMCNELGITRLLIKYSSDVNSRDENGETPLHKACKNSNLYLTSILIKEGNAQVNIPNHQNFTAIDYAVKNEDVELVIFLLEHGAKIPQSAHTLMAFFAKKLQEYRSDQVLNNKMVEIVIPSSTLSEDMRTLLNNKAYKDVTFQVEGKCISALKGVLCARSEFFRVMFSSTLQESTKLEIELTDVTSNAFEQVLEFIYTDNIDIQKMSFEEALTLLSAANRYMLDRLKRICEKFIIENIRLSNVSYIFQAADLYEAEYLRAAAIFFIANHYQKMIDIDDVTQIDCFSDWIVKFFRKYLEENIQVSKEKDSNMKK
eukprot:TRINITY_DN7886_c0_g1_i1.p1 TRINITY_DN7886_c0_g1~~TRINITY_DN7886_c0_g1_i1.p1  ORF type:complete len:498 (+),score=140.45 TRINITY_DN7886_c0_g1_i1:194-1687(+)